MAATASINANNYSHTREFYYCLEVYGRCWPNTSRAFSPLFIGISGPLTGGGEVFYTAYKEP
jgi:hypothetical protein